MKLPPQKNVFQFQTSIFCLGVPGELLRGYLVVKVIGGGSIEQHMNILNSDVVVTWPLIFAIFWFIETIIFEFQWGNDPPPQKKTRESYMVHGRKDVLPREPEVFFWLRWILTVYNLTGKIRPDLSIPFQGFRSQKSLKKTHQRTIFPLLSTYPKVSSQPLLALYWCQTLGV